MFQRRISLQRTYHISGDIFVDYCDVFSFCFTPFQSNLSSQKKALIFLTGRMVDKRVPSSLSSCHSTLPSINNGSNVESQTVVSYGPKLVGQTCQKISSNSCDDRWKRRSNLGKFCDCTWYSKGIHSTGSLGWENQSHWSNNDLGEMGCWFRRTTTFSSRRRRDYSDWRENDGTLCLLVLVLLSLRIKTQALELTDRCCFSKLLRSNFSPKMPRASWSKKVHLWSSLLVKLVTSQVIIQHHP